MYALIRARVHRGAAVEDVANVCHGDAPFAHPPVAVGSRSNLHGIMIRSQDTPKDIPPQLAGGAHTPARTALPWMPPTRLFAVPYRPSGSFGCGEGAPKDTPALYLRAQLLRTLLLGTSVDISSGDYPSS